MFSLLSHRSSDRSQIGDRRLNERDIGLSDVLGDGWLDVDDCNVYPWVVGKTVVHDELADDPGASGH